MIPGMIDRLSGVDKRTDQWLADHGTKWRWPRRQGSQGSQNSTHRERDPVDSIDPLTLLVVRGELLQVLESAEGNGLNPDVIDSPEAVSTAAAAKMNHSTQRAVQGHMRGKCEAERHGQMSLPGMPRADEVYAAAGGEK